MLFRTIVNSLADQIPELPDNLEQLLEYPPNADIGDVALPCFHLARTMRQNPQQIAQQLAKQISHPAFQAEAAGPYLNFRLNRPQFAMELLRTADTDDFWKPKLGRGERIVIDMSSPNIAKPFGIGHLRSTMIGNALYRILREVGYDSYVWRQNAANHPSSPAICWISHRRSIASTTIPKYWQAMILSKLRSSPWST